MGRRKQLKRHQARMRKKPSYGSGGRNDCGKV